MEKSEITHKVRVEEMKEITKAEKCARYFANNGIDSYRDGEDVFITVNGLHILVSSSEVSYRAELYDECKSGYMED